MWIIKKSSGLFKAIKSFKQECKGVLLIEAALVIFGISMVLYLVTDFGRAFMLQGRLEQATYSLASIFRERTALYSKNEETTLDEYNELHELARIVLSNPDVILQIDAIYFTGDKDNREFQRVVSYPASDRDKCKSKLPPIQTLYELSPRSSLDRWMPLYRVTVCIPGEFSLFKALVNASASNEQFVIEEFISSNVVLPR